MVFAVSMLVQIAGIISGIYLMFADSFGRGLALVVAIVVIHWVFSMLSNFVMYLHQQTLSEHEKEGMVSMANLGFMKEATPPTWRIISAISAVLFWITAGSVIFWFLNS